MTSIIKVNELQDAGGNTIISSNGTGTFTSNLPSAVNTPAFQAYRTANQTLGGNNTFTKVQFTAENFDTDNLYDNSTNYRFTPNTSDKYMIYSHVQIGATAVDRNGISEIAIYKNGSKIAVSIIDSRQASSLGGYRFTCTINYVIQPNGSTDYYEIYARCFDNSGNTPELVHDTNGSIVFGAYKLIGT